MLGVVLIVYVCLSVYATLTFRTTVRLQTLSRFNWALQIADNFVKFGNYDDTTYHDHIISDYYDVSDFEYLDVSANVYDLGDYQSPNGNHTVCINRYGVNMDREVKKLVVCVK